MGQCLLELPPKLHSQLKHLAVDRDTTLKGLIIDLLTQGVNGANPQVIPLRR